LFFKSAISRKAIFMWGISPCSDRLIPSSIFFWHGNMRIIHKDSIVWSLLGMKVGGIRLITAHIVSWVHALILTEPILAWHSQ
jgi:hypothetical protein